MESLEEPVEESLPLQPRVTYDISSDTIAKIFLSILAIWLTVQVWPVIVIVGLALMLVATFNPFVRRLEARVPRHWAIAIILVAIGGIVLAIMSLLVPVLVQQTISLVTNLPKYSHSVQAVLAEYHIRVDGLKYAEQASEALTARLPAWLTYLTEIFLAAATVCVLTIYILIEGNALSSTFYRLLPRPKRLSARRMMAEIGRQVGGYMRGQLLTSLLAGLTSFLVLYLLEVPEAFTLAAITALTDAIPLIGLAVAVVPAALMALSISPAKALIVAGVFLLYHQLENHIIAPRVYGQILGLSFTTIVVSFLVGGQLMGIIGALVALPVAAALPSIFSFISAWHGEDPEPSGPNLPG